MNAKKIAKRLASLSTFSTGIMFIYLINALSKNKGIYLLYPILVFFIMGIIVGIISFLFRLEMNLAVSPEEKKEWETLYVVTSWIFAFYMLGFTALFIAKMINPA